MIFYGNRFAGSFIVAAQSGVNANVVSILHFFVLPPEMRCHNHQNCKLIIAPRMLENKLLKRISATLNDLLFRA